MKITAIRLDRMRLPLDPPLRAAWDPVPRRAFDATLVRVETDEGVTGYGSGDTALSCRHPDRVHALDARRRRHRRDPHRGAAAGGRGPPPAPWTTPAVLG